MTYFESITEFSEDDLFDFLREVSALGPPALAKTHPDDELAAAVHRSGCGGELVGQATYTVLGTSEKDGVREVFLCDRRADGTPGPGRFRLPLSAFLELFAEVGTSSRVLPSTSAVKNWPDFLKKLSDELFETADEFELEVLQEEEPERIKSRWLGFPGAAPEAIAARETALGTKLPDDYRAFLLASNGFRGLGGRPHGLCALLPVEEIGWTRDKDERAGRLAGYLEDRRRGVEVGEEFMVDPEDFARTILIGDSDGNECILLLPPKTSSEWEVWTYHPETGFLTGDTFQELMESALEGD